MARGMFSATFLTLLFTLSMLIVCVPCSAEKEKPPYEKFAYSLPVEANWTNTLTYLDIGELIKFSGSGAIRPTTESPLIGPEGQGDAGAGAGYSCPSLPPFSLLARIGYGGDCLLVGEKTQITPGEPGFLFLAINSKDDVRDVKGGAGKFDIIIEIFRPTCGDSLCEEGESGYCAEDCDWCGDAECNANETCSICSKDCGFCEGDISSVENKTKEYFSMLQENDFTGLVDVTTGKFRDYYDEFKRFMREFEKSINMLGIEKENELLPEFKFESIDVMIDEMRDSEAVVNATVDSKKYQFKLVKEDSAWKLKDMREASDKEWFTTDLDLKSLRDNHNEYLSKITEEEGLTPAEIKVDAAESGIAKTIIIIIVIIVVALGVLYYLFFVRKKRHIKLSFLKLPKHKKLSTQEHKEKEKSEQHAKAEAKERAVKEKVSKDKAEKEQENEMISISGESKCPKCGAEVFAHERFCVKCGTKLKKKK